MSPSRSRVAILSAALCSLGLARLSAQMQLSAPLEGELCPLVACTDENWYVLKGGEKRLVQNQECHIRPGSAFGEGFVEVTDIRADLDPLRNEKPEDRSKPNAIHFRYQASLVADRSMSNCYACLSFITEGSLGTRLIPLGRLGAGKAKPIDLKLPSQVDAVGSIHIFSGGLEIRSTQHREAYDVMAYYAALVKNLPSLSAAELLKAENDYQFRLSADGRLLAVVKLRDAKKVLFVYDLESMKVLCENAVADEDQAVADPTWVSDHEVAYVATEKHPGTFRRDSKLYLLDARTGASRVVSDDVDGILLAIPDDPEKLVLWHGWWTEKFDLRTKKSTDLQELESGYFLFDRAGNDRVMIRYEGDKVTYFVRPKPGERWREIDDLVKQAGLHFNTRGAQMLDRVVDVHSVGPDGDTLYVSVRLNGSDRFELAAFSMSEGVIKHPIAAHPKYDLTTSDGGQSRLLFARDSTRLIGMIYEAKKLQVVWLDPRYAAAQKSMDATFPDHVNIPVDWSKDGDTFVYFSSSEQDPGTYYVFKPRESRLIPVLELGERLKGKALAKTESIEFTARDGQKIPAYVTRPPHPGTGPAPLLVYVHGGPMARDSWRFDATNQFFASRGYLVLQVNYRGSSGYGAAFQGAGLRARLDTVVLDDIADGVHYLIDQKEADPARVVMMGGSFGGWATYMSLIKYPELYRAGIAIAAVANWRKFIKDDRLKFDNKLAYTFWKSLLNRADFDAEEKMIDPLLRADEIKQPLFIIHGEWDLVVSSGESGMMLNAVKKHNPKVQALSFPYASHSYWSFADRVVMLNEIALFLDRNLGPPGTGTAAAGAP